MRAAHVLDCLLSLMETHCQSGGDVPVGAWLQARAVQRHSQTLGGEVAALPLASGLTHPGGDPFTPSLQTAPESSFQKESFEAAPHLTTSHLLPAAVSSAAPDGRYDTSLFHRAAVRAGGKAPPPGAVLRLHARCAPSFVGVLYGPGGSHVQTLQRAFGGAVKVTGPTPRKTFGVPFLGAATLPLEVAGIDHDAVRACAREVDFKYASFAGASKK